jgi:hypothetical protein
MKTQHYYHKTSGGAEYLTDAFIDCGKHKEGIFEGARYIVRLDGQPELTDRKAAEHAALVAVAEAADEHNRLHSINHNIFDEKELAQKKRLSFIKLNAALANLAAVRGGKAVQS